MKIRVLLLLIAVLSVVSCASYFKRKDCEKANWFEHGQKVAKEGRTLESDSFVNECRQVKAEFSWQQLDLGFKKGREFYCSPEGSFRTGKEGHVFNGTMCDGPGGRNLLARYNAGLQEYCDPSNGEPDGASGHVYENVCPKNKEAAFLKGYRKGRISYLTGQIESLHVSIREKQNEASRLNSEAMNESNVATNLEAQARRRQTQHVYNPVTGRTEVKTTDEVDQNLMMKATNHRNEASSLKSRASYLRSEASKMQEKKLAFEAEVRTLSSFK